MAEYTNRKPLESLGGKDLVDGFQFSQGSLQDFMDCRRRFQLRYIWGLSWPAVESEPVEDNENMMRLGAAFHKMVHQHQVGIDAERLDLLAVDDTLKSWWQNYKNMFCVDRGLENFSGIQKLRGKYPEIALATALSDYRLAAKYDLILIGENGKALIIDWKTSKFPLRRQRLEDRLQTRVYLYLLKKVAERINDGKGLAAEDITMAYWFSAHPRKTERFDYSSKKFESDEQFLINLVDTIINLDAESFQLTSEKRKCRFCVYRSLCDRGQLAGRFDEKEGEDLVDDSPLELEIDFDQIAEIEF